MDENTKLILDKLQSLGGDTIDVDTSTKGKVKVKTLNFKQQKELISTIADGALGGLKLQKILNNIVIENAGDDFNSVDKLPIVVALRIKAIGKEYKINDVVVDLDKIYAKLVKIKYPKPPTIKKLGINIVLQTPSVAADNKIVHATLESLKRDKDELGKNIQDIYTYEIIKYIKSIEFGDSILAFDEVSLPDKYKIVNNLTISINNDITQYIQKIKQLERDAFSYEKDGESRYFDIDASFFDS